jgi:small subunit ribosomal protein S17
MEQGNVQAAAESAAGRRPRRRRVGVVVSDVRDKTITVQFEHTVEHSRYGKQMRRRSAMQVHDPENQARVGDRVQVMECRPISKTKTWRLEKVLTAAPRTAP